MSTQYKQSLEELLNQTATLRQLKQMLTVYYFNAYKRGELSDKEYQRFTKNLWSRIRAYQLASKLLTNDYPDLASDTIYQALCEGCTLDDLAEMQQEVDDQYCGCGAEMVTGYGDPVCVECL